MMNTGAGRPARNAGLTNQSRLILGVDGGGTKTMALVAAVDDTGQMTIIGRTHLPSRPGTSSDR